MASGAYLFRHINGKNIPTEVEYLTDDERAVIFKDRSHTEIMNWFNMMCKIVGETYPQEKEEK